MTYLADQRTTGTPDPAEIITFGLSGSRTFRTGRRTAAHLQWTADQCRPGTWLHVVQGSYNTTVAASAGTHDGDGVIDVSMSGLTWAETEWFMRECGWAAWHRTVAQGFSSEHVHAVSLGCPGPVGVFVPGQVEDYYAHRTGLAGHAADDTRHPVDIDSTVFDYPAWLEGQPMNDTDKQWLSDLIDAKLAANNTTLVKAVWDSAVNKSKDTARAALRKAAGL